MAIHRTLASVATACATAVGLMLVAPAPASADVVPGDYRIAFEGHGAEMVPLNGSPDRIDLRVWPHDHVGMEWGIEQVGYSSGMPAYEIYNLRSNNLCMQPKDGRTAVNQRVEQAPCSGRPKQRWHIPSVEGNSHHIVPVKDTELGVTLEDPNNTGSFLQLGYRSEGTPDFRWHFNRF